MKDKELRNLLDEEGFIYTKRCNDSHISSRGMWSIGSKLQEVKDKLQDQQEQIDFILKHLNIDIEKFEGYVKKKLDK
jgi:hypothetical protein